MEWQLIGVFLTLGAVVGVLAGLLGVGGGGVMVPVLTTIFIAQHYPNEQVVHVALATSMAAIVPTALASLRAHQKKNAIIWPVVWQITPTILIGTFLATFLATYLSSRTLAIFFACFMTYVALQMWLGAKPKSHRNIPGVVGLSSAGLVIGSISALVAIGGGSLTVPYLMWCNVNIRHAIATSAAVGFPIAIAGTIGYLINGWHVQGLPAYTIGFVYWPAVILIAVSSFFTTKIGAHLAHSLPVNTLKKAFAILVVGLSIKMIMSVI